VNDTLRIVLGVVLLVGMAVFLAAWIVAEVRAAVWMRTPPTDPWVKHTVR